MQPHWPLALLCAALFLSHIGACASGAQLDQKTRTLDDLIVEARQQGAQRCAPRELALAESHNDFAKQDLFEGNPFRAREEIGIAETNVREALRKSPEHICAIKVASAPGDSDGDGIADDLDQCPTIAEDLDGFEDDDGCPDVDNDGDGIVDDADGCPLEAEDKDGMDDADGCPEEDRDGDGIADELDACIDEPEDRDGYEDEDGCPDCDNDGDGVLECPEPKDLCPNKAADTPDGCPQYQMVKVTAKKIELRQTIYFEYNQDTIKARSFPLLDEVGQVLSDNPEISVRIEGHTDSRGGAGFNMRLSQARAESVRAYLIERGVDGDRVQAKGYGESAPIASNRNNAGRAKNRRVEFVILGR